MKQVIIASIILLAAIAAGATYATADTYRVNWLEMGGGMGDAYVERILKIDEAGDNVQIRTPVCASYCTLYLLADNVCVGPNVQFAFHGPSAGWTLAATLITGLPMPVHGMSQERHDQIVDVLVEAYNERYPGLGDWFRRRASDKFGIASVGV